MKRVTQSACAALLAAFMLFAAAHSTRAAEGACDKVCLEAIGARYRAAYLAHKPTLAPFAKTVRYTENNIEMPFPDGTWDTVTQEVFTETEWMRGSLRLNSRQDVPHGQAEYSHGNALYGARQIDQIREALQSL